jgi:GTP cyclohydrolase I
MIATAPDTTAPRRLDITPDQSLDVFGRGPDLPRLEEAVREMLLALGEDPGRDGLVDTPRRVARSMAEMTGGLWEDPAQHLGRVFQQQHDDLVLVRGIRFNSLCEHHLLPFHGSAHVAYLPGEGHVVGLSKLARTVSVYARRPQVQERMTNQIAEAIAQHLQPRGIAVLLEAEHMCMSVRGVECHGSNTVTTALRGQLRDDQALREEVMRLMHPGRESMAWG